MLRKWMVTTQNGAKMWIIILIADVAIVWAKNMDEEGTPIRGFL